MKNSVKAFWKHINKYIKKDIDYFYCKDTLCNVGDCPHFIICTSLVEGIPVSNQKEKIIVINKYLKNKTKKYKIKKILIRIK